jgi:dolichol-phosphate mannosyltransferase
MNSNKKKIIVLTPVYNEADSLHRYMEKVSDILLLNKDYNFSILFIDDGSVDGSWELIREFSRKEPLRFHGVRKN